MYPPEEPYIPKKNPVYAIVGRKGRWFVKVHPKEPNVPPRRALYPSKEPCIRNCRKEGEVVREYTLERALHIAQKSPIYPQKNPVYTIVGREVGS